MLTFLREKNILSLFHEQDKIWICKQCQSVPSGCFPELWFMSSGHCICYHRPRKVIRQRGFPCRGPLPSLSSDILIFFPKLQAGEVLWVPPYASAVYYLFIHEGKSSAQCFRHRNPHFQPFRTDLVNPCPPGLPGVQHTLSPWGLLSLGMGNSTQGLEFQLLPAWGGSSPKSPTPTQSPRQDRITMASYSYLIIRGRIWNIPGVPCLQSHGTSAGPLPSAGHVLAHN